MDISSTSRMTALLRQARGATARAHREIQNAPAQNSGCATIRCLPLTTLDSVALAVVMAMAMAVAVAVAVSLAEAEAEVINERRVPVPVNKKNKKKQKTRNQQRRQCAAQVDEGQSSSPC